MQGHVIVPALAGREQELQAHGAFIALRWKTGKCMGSAVPCMGVSGAAV
jgi:hypothetical protein